MSSPIARHPGGVIRRRLMEPRGLTMTDLAKAMDISVSSVSRVLNEKSELTADMAIRISHVLGGEAETWLAMQTRFNLSQAAQQVDREKLTRFPYADPA